MLRPIRREDAAAELDFIHRLSPRSRYLRVFGEINDVSPELIAHLTQIDLDREMALVAVAESPPGERLIGVARYAIEPGTGGCEFAIVVDDQWQGTGLARKLMDALIDAARDYHHLDTMHGETFAEHVRMLGLARELGVDARRHPADSHLVLLRRTL
jgi:acetyltransferase